MDSKSNEIAAIPQLLDLMDVEGTIITIDALGCQKSIAERIIDKKGGYTFVVNDNHPELAAALEAFSLQAHEEKMQAESVRAMRHRT